jgi:hypothetical protein
MAAEKQDWVKLADELGRGFAERCAQHDANDTFVAENYAALKERGMFAAGVPSELGGGGASLAELCGMIRTLARHCSSTGLAFSMHTHIIAGMAFGWRSGNKAPEALLKRVADEKLVLISTGGSDWLDGSGKLTKVDGRGDGRRQATRREVASRGARSRDACVPDPLRRVRRRRRRDARPRLFRDVQGVRYDPVQEKPATKLIGRHLLGLELDA